MTDTSGGRCVGAKRRNRFFVLKRRESLRRTMRLMLQGGRMVINWRIICALLICAAHRGMCMVIENGLVQPVDEDCIVISRGGHWVNSDPWYCDALDVLVSITGGDQFDDSIKKEGRYRFRTMLGPFGYAAFTGWGNMKKPLMAGDVRLVRTSALVGGIDKESAIRMLVGVKDSLNRVIRHEGFMERRKGEHGVEIVSSGPVMGGWKIAMSVEAAGDEMWRFDLQMEHVGLAVRDESRTTRDWQEVEVICEI